MLPIDQGDPTVTLPSGPIARLGGTGLDVFGTMGGGEREQIEG
jgi:hypothetical protein